MGTNEHNTMTELERVTSAYITTLSAWLYPNDDDVREVAVQMVRSLGMDYVELIAWTMENAEVPGTEIGAEDPPMLDADSARFQVADSFRLLMLKLTLQGHGPRRNVTMTAATDDDDYGSLA